jgi:hypothetical protein
MDTRFYWFIGSLFEFLQCSLWSFYKIISFLVYLCKFTLPFSDWLHIVHLDRQLLHTLILRNVKISTANSWSIEMLLFYSFTLNIYSYKTYPLTWVHYWVYFLWIYRCPCRLSSRVNLAVFKVEYVFSSHLIVTAWRKRITQWILEHIIICIFWTSTHHNFIIFTLSCTRTPHPLGPLVQSVSISYLSNISVEARSETFLSR